MRTENLRSGFSLGEIEAVLSHMFRIDPAKRATFAARLQQLQRMGLPAGAQPGRGKRFRYEFWQVADYALCVDLLDAGLPPNLLKVHFSQGFYSLVGTGHKAQVHPPTPQEGLHLFLEVNALNYLRSADEGIAGENAADHLMKFRTGAAYLCTDDASTPVIAVNLSKRLADLRHSIEQVVPALSGEATFPAPTPAPGVLA